MRTFSYALLIAGCVFSLSAATSSIGIVRSYGDFRVDGAAVHGNSTLMAGDVVETMALNTTINVGATQVTLLPESRATLYSDRTTLQRGTSLLRGASSHAIEAGSLRIVPTSSHSLVEVGYNDRKLITISAHAGAANVFTSSGELLASLNPGSALAFEPSSGATGSASGQASASGDIKLKGLLIARDGKYFLSMGGKNYEVTSSTVNLASYAGKVIDMTGSIIKTTAELTVVSVGSVTVVAVAAGAGVSTAAIMAVVVGAAAVGTVGGFAAAGSFSGGSASVP